VCILAFHRRFVLTLHTDVASDSQSSIYVSMVLLCSRGSPLVLMWLERFRISCRHILQSTTSWTFSDLNTLSHPICWAHLPKVWSAIRAARSASRRQRTTAISPAGVFGNKYTMPSKVRWHVSRTASGDPRSSAKSSWYASDAVDEEKIRSDDMSMWAVTLNAPLLAKRESAVARARV
jgi:hypothetical protein